MGGANDALSAEFKKKFAIQCGDSFAHVDMSGISASVKEDTCGAMCRSRISFEKVTVISDV
jgi:hypothetical protein